MPGLLLLEKQIFRYNSFYNYFIKKVPQPFGKGGKESVNEKIDTVTYLLDRLRKRQITGNAALDLVENFLSDFDKESREFITKIIERDLKAGISTSIINKVFPKLIPVFDVVLADKYKPGMKINRALVDIFDGTWFVNR